jgi:hypothetical protein
LRDALRIVRRVIDDGTRFRFSKTVVLLQVEGFQSDQDGSYNSTVRFEREQITQSFCDLLRGTEHYPALIKALEQNSISDSKLKVLHSKPDEELKYFLNPEQSMSYDKPERPEERIGEFTLAPQVSAQFGALLMRKLSGARCPNAEQCLPNFWPKNRRANYRSFYRGR